jgi:DUF971 family protein
MNPIQLEKTTDRCLLITWSDDTQQKIPFRKLRDNCRCANCIEKRMDEAKPDKPTNVLPVLSAAEAQPLDILQMHPVGNYAYNIHFSDGHSAGIFTFELLRSLQ